MIIFFFKANDDRKPSKTDQPSLSVVCPDLFRLQLEQNRKFAFNLMKLLDECWLHPLSIDHCVLDQLLHNLGLNISNSNYHDDPYSSNLNQSDLLLKINNGISPPLWLIQALIKHPYLVMREMVSLLTYSKYVWIFNQRTNNTCLFIVFLTIL